MIEPKLGCLIEGGAPLRDAVHIALAPVTAGATLQPGDHVGFLGDGRVGKTLRLIGIVDPFLDYPVKSGERFWMLIYQGSITSLRHDWEHPAFQQTPSGEIQPASASETWIREYADSVGLTYADMMNGARDWLSHGEYLSRGSLLEGVRVPDDFWRHYEKVTGAVVPERDQESFFTCSC